MSNKDKIESLASWPQPGSYRKSIRLEFSLYMSLMILVLMAVTGYVIKEQNVETATHNVEQSLFLQARSYSGAASKSMISLSSPDALMLGNICSKFKADNPDVYWSAISGRDDIYLAHTDIRQVIAGARMMIPGGQRIDRDLRPDERLALTNDTMYVLVPIFENGVRLGHLSAASSVRQIEEARQRAIITAIITTALMVLFGVPVTMIVLHRKLRPVSIITRSLKSINLDDMSIDLPIRLRNEFGYLAETLRVMSNRLGLAQRERIEKERIERELEIAREIQENILPREYPQAPRFEFAGVYRSAREVGGDYYDFIDLDKDHLAFLVADVSGKSLPGMLVMLLTRDIVKRLTRTIHEPAELLSAVNRELMTNVKKGMFVTMFFGVLTRENGEFKFASAGHNPLLMVDGANGETKLFKTKGYPLGMMPPGQFDGRIESATVTLGRNDWLAQYTDGINEAQNDARQEFGMDRLVECLRTYRGLGPGDMVKEILRQHDEFVGSAQQYDDITMLAMKWSGQAADRPTPRRQEQANVN